jgi:hypothetical protein
MYQHHQLYTSCMCQIINYSSHVCANSSTTCLNHVPNMYLNHIPKTYTNITIKIYLTIHHSIHKPLHKTMCHKLTVMYPQAKPTTSGTHHNQKTNTHMPITKKKIPSVSLNKSDICSNTEHPIPSQELNSRSQKIPQTRCAISVINRPQPCCFRNFSTAHFLPHFFYHDFFVVIFLPHFFCHTFPFAIFLPHFSCHTFSTANFLYQ